MQEIAAFSTARCVQFNTHGARDGDSGHHPSCTAKSNPDDRTAASFFFRTPLSHILFRTSNTAERQYRTCICYDQYSKCAYGMGNMDVARKGEGYTGTDIHCDNLRGNGRLWTSGWTVRVCVICFLSKCVMDIRDVRGNYKQ